jgi:hypothetical protein
MIQIKMSERTIPVAVFEVDVAIGLASSSSLSKSSLYSYQDESLNNMADLIDKSQLSSDN